MMAGTIEVRRPWVRDLEQRFESRLLPLSVRRTEQVGELLPQLYLHGLAQGDFELALRGLLDQAIERQVLAVAGHKRAAVSSCQCEMNSPRNVLSIQACVDDPKAGELDNDAWNIWGALGGLPQPDFPDCSP